MKIAMSELLHAVPYGPSSSCTTVTQREGCTAVLDTEKMVIFLDSPRGKVIIPLSNAKYVRVINETPPQAPPVKK